jgi:hypothetical protein
MIQQYVYLAVLKLWCMVISDCYSMIKKNSGKETKLVTLKVGTAQTKQ